MNLMYASSSLTPMSVKPRIQSEKVRFDFFRKMMQDAFRRVDKQQLIPGKEYYVNNMPIVRNYVDESHWILMHGKYIGPAAYPGGTGNLKGHEFADLTYVYISEYNDKLTLSGQMILAENWCQFIYDPAQPSDADIAKHVQFVAQIGREFDAMRAEPVAQPGNFVPWIGSDFRAARDRQTDPETGRFWRRLVIPLPYSRSALPYKTNKNNKNKNNKKKTSSLSA